MTAIHHPSYALILKLIDESFSPQKQISIIDYGCGNGYLLDLISSKRIKSYLGLDPNVEAIKVAQSKYKTKTNIQFELLQKDQLISLGKSNSTDLIILIGVLQYMNAKETTHLFQESHKVLKKGGTLIASCVVDHALYKYTSLYRLFLPNNYINRKKLLGIVIKNKFVIAYIKEKGLILGHLFSHNIVIFFDVLDKLIFHNKGELGPLGKFTRQISTKILQLEYLLPIDYGYTLFLKIIKK